MQAFRMLKNKRWDQKTTIFDSPLQFKGFEVMTLVITVVFGEMHQNLNLSNKTVSEDKPNLNFFS